MAKKKNKDKLVKLLGVRHIDTETYLQDSIKAVDKQLKIIKKPVIGIELSDGVLELFTKLAKNPRFIGKSHLDELMASEHQRFFIGLVKHLVNNYPDIKLVGLDSKPLRDYVGKLWNENRELAEHGRMSVKELIGARKIRENNVNIAIVGTLHIPGYEMLLPKARTAYRVPPNTQEELESAQKRKIYHEKLERMKAQRLKQHKARK